MLSNLKAETARTGVSVMGGVERVKIEIPRVQVVGEFPIKRFLETIYNAAAKQYNVKLTATVLPKAEHERAEEPPHRKWA